MTDTATPTSPLRTVRTSNLLAVDAFADLLREHHLDTLEALFAIPNDQALNKPGLERWRERIRLTLDIDDGTSTFYLKRYSTPPRRAMREVRRSGSGAASHAGVEWTWMHRLAADDIPCVKPVAMGEELDRHVERRSALLMEEAGGESLERWVQQNPAPALVRSLLEPLAALVARLHTRGYVHRDLYLSHLFHDPTRPPGESLTLIDLQRVARPRTRLKSRIIKDLAALNYSTPRHVASRTDRLRWLTHYLGIRKLDAPARKLLYRVVGKTQQIARHDRRRRARLQGRQT